jgi:hypothetical protein
MFLEGLRPPGRNPTVEEIGAVGAKGVEADRTGVFLCVAVRVV